MASQINIVMNNLDTVPNMIYGTLLIITIAYVHLIPESTRALIDSTAGRVLGIIGLILTLRYIGWIYALLFALAFILILHGAPSTIQEGFNSIQGKNVERPKSRWFVEQVLGEHTARIETDTVHTDAVQDL